MAGIWLDRIDWSKLPRHNDADSRAVRYPRYLEQVLCTQQRLQTLFDVLKQRGLWDEAIVVVHGDHGARIDVAWPKGDLVAEMTPADFIDGYSTLFAVKLPGEDPRCDRRQQSINQLFLRHMLGERSAADADRTDQPAVFVRSQDSQRYLHPMPIFAHGRAP
jgi:arylsulfatase A-like enzyme